MKSFHLFGAILLIVGLVMSVTFGAAVGGRGGGGGGGGGYSAPYYTINTAYSCTNNTLYDVVTVSPQASGVWVAVDSLSGLTMFKGYTNNSGQFSFASCGTPLNVNVQSNLQELNYSCSLCASPCKSDSDCPSDMACLTPAGAPANSSNAGICSPLNCPAGQTPTVRACPCNNTAVSCPTIDQCSIHTCGVQLQCPNGQNSTVQACDAVSVTYVASCQAESCGNETCGVTAPCPPRFSCPPGQQIVTKPCNATTTALAPNCQVESCAPLSGSCTSNSSCPDNETCQNGMCSCPPGYTLSCASPLATNCQPVCKPPSCSSDRDCPAGLVCQGKTCQQEPRPCSMDSQCGDNQQCLDAAGKAPQPPELGACQNISGCGSIGNHTLTAYECGPNCPACPSGSVCDVDHRCAPVDMNCPPTAVVNDIENCTVTKNGQPSGQCTVTVTDPNGNAYNESCDPNGTVQTPPLATSGVWSVVLSDNGTILKTLQITAMPKSTPSESAPPTANQGLLGGWLVWLVILIIIAIAAFLYLRSRPKGPPAV